MEGLIISQPNVSFVDLATGVRHNHIWKYLQMGGWKSIKPNNFEYNNLKGVLKRNEWKPVIGDLMPIHPGMIWDGSTKTIIDPTYLPQAIEPGMNNFLNAADAFFRKYDKKRIGVQLSGGLDSSIIIGLLRHLGIPFHLVGMATNRYEFRTERYIQEIIRKWTECSTLIDYEQHLPMSNLEDIPPFQYPDLLALNFSSERAMAEECQQQGVQVLFTGDGGDNLFAESVPDNPEECTWLPQVFSDSWLADIVYAPCGIELVPFYADPGIMDVVYNLRRGQVEDNSKLWARNFFKDFLPLELVNFSYCADFWGLYIDGLQQAVPKVHKLFKTAHEISGHHFFSEVVAKELLGQDLLHAKKEIYQVIEARASLALWLNILNKNELIGL